MGVFNGNSIYNDGASGGGGGGGGVWEDVSNKIILSKINDVGGSVKLFYNDSAKLYRLKIVAENVSGIDSNTAYVLARFNENILSGTNILKYMEIFDFYAWNYPLQFYDNVIVSNRDISSYNFPLYDNDLRFIRHGADTSIHLWWCDDLFWAAPST